MGKPSHLLANTSESLSNSLREEMLLALSMMNYVLVTVKEPDVVEFCQRVGMKSERGAQVVWLSD